MGPDSQPSWCSHLSPSQNTRPPHCCAPAGLHISLSLRQLLPGHPTILISPQLPLPLPQLPSRVAATGQILLALSLAPHKPGLALGTSCSQAGAFLNRDSSFWQKLPASDPDFSPGCLTAGCDPARRDSPCALLDNCAPFRNCTRSLKLSALTALSRVFTEGGLPKASYFLGTTKSFKKYQLSFETKNMIPPFMEG